MLSGIIIFFLLVTIAAMGKALLDVKKGLETLVPWVIQAKQALANAGICDQCLVEGQMDDEGPFSFCDCGICEDYADRPLQKLQILERTQSRSTNI